MNAIELNNITKIYPRESKKALNIQKLTIKSGQIFGLTGPNGAGKTTFISILCKLISPTSGNALIFEHAINGANKEINKIIGLVPQMIALYPSLTAKENLEFFGAMQGLKKENLDLAIKKTLDLSGLNEKADARVSTFSGGMKRRLNLVCGLIHNPKLLFLDEPTVGIDPQSRNLIFDNLIKLKDEGMTIIYSTHYMEEITKICDTAAILDRGKIIGIDTPSNWTQKHALETGSMEEVFLKLTGKDLRD